MPFRVERLSCFDQTMNNVLVEIHVGQGGWTMDIKESREEATAHFQVGRSKLFSPSHGEAWRRPNHAVRIHEPWRGGEGEKESISSKSDNNVTVQGHSR